MTHLEFDIVTSRKQMIDLFFLTLDHKLLASTFYGGVSNSEDFVRLMEGAHLYVTIYAGEVVGYSWVNMFSGRSAAVHVCLFPTAPKHLRVLMGKTFLKFILFAKDDENQYRFDSLVGLVPETHKHVEIFALSIGMNYQCIIPSGMAVVGEVVDLAILTITREDLTED